VYEVGKYKPPRVDGKIHKNPSYGGNRANDENPLGSAALRYLIASEAQGNSRASPFSVTSCS
jgi:hypothetical protein